MKRLIYIFLLLFAACVACDDTNVGYLETDDAGYDPDSMVIRKVLDPVLDAGRIERQYPWVSTQLQGILGTVPYSYRIAGVHTDDGDVASFTKGVKLRGDSAFEIPVVNEINRGTYYIDVAIINRGYEHVKDSAFILIVK